MKNARSAALLLGAIASAPAMALDPQMVGRYASGVFDEGAAEIVTYHPASRRILVVNADAGTVDVIDASGLESRPVGEPLTASTMEKQYSLILAEDITDLDIGNANSIAVHGDLLAVAVEADDKQASGVVAFYRLDENGEASYLGHRGAGALPDMVTFTPDGSRVLVANEGEPSDDYSVDPAGSITIIDITNGEPADAVRTAGFEAFNDSLDPGVRVFGPGATPAQDLEPEYIAVSADSATAWVSLQENNAVAIVDIDKAEITAVVPLGLKDYGEHAIDASDKDGAVNMSTYPGVVGMYQPDAIAAIAVDGEDYILTANEGDARDYWFDADSEQACLDAGGSGYDDEDGCLAFSEEVRAGKLEVEGDRLDPALVSDEAALGRLKVTTTLGDTDGNGRYETLYNYGGRSFSVRDSAGGLVWDSGEQIGRITAYTLAMDFNNTDNENEGDNRSDDKGAEPEAITAGHVNGVPYAFVGLERTGGFMVYDLSDPAAPRFVSYHHNRDFDADDPADAGDLAPEGMHFVAPEDSATGRALLIIGHEVSGSTTVYELR